MNKCIIIAGVNGAGKTTLYDLLGSDIKAMFRQEYAGVDAEKNISRCIEKGVDFCLETSLCEEPIIELVKQAHEKDYYIEIYYVLVSNTEKAIQRVHDRVVCGGHHVDDSIIESRFNESLLTLFNLGKTANRIVF